MRLAQLARRIGRSQSDIVKFLSKQGVIVLEESNARIDDDQTTLVIQHFAPEQLEEIRKIEEVEEVNESIIEPEPESLSTENNENAIVTLEESQVIQRDEAVINQDEVEVIKAPKIELPGLKVIGKIELPETKKKAAEDIGAKTQAIQTSAKPKERNYKREPYKNPIEFQREREAREKEKKKQEQAAYLKELKTQRYLNKVRRPTDIYKEPKERQSVDTKKPAQSVRPRPSGSILSRFLKWMSGK